MAPIVSSVEIVRRPEDVFSYVSDPSRLAEWQDSVVSAHAEGCGPPAVGSKAITTRRIGRGERTMTMELTEITRPRRSTRRFRYRVGAGICADVPLAPASDSMEAPGCRPGTQERA